MAPIKEYIEYKGYMEYKPQKQAPAKKGFNPVYIVYGIVLILCGIMLVIG